MVIWEEFFDENSITFTTCPDKGRRGALYCNEVCAFDIETTRLPEIEQAFLFIWQFSIGNKTVVLGRDWSSFLRLLNKLERRLGERRLLIFVHNLSFEFQFLSGIYNFKPDEVFCVDSRKILFCSMFNKFEFRCSYRLTNLSLKAFAEKYSKNWKKKSGEAFKYKEERFPWTPLTRRELLYCVNDVLALVDAVRGLMELHGDSVGKLPFTQTGFVRRELKSAMRPHAEEVRSAFPTDPYLYRCLRAAFRGGNTHASRFFAGEILENVSSVDISSSYPAQQVLKQFPETAFTAVPFPTVRELYHLKDERGMALLIHARLDGVELRRRWEPVPYLAFSKCVNVSGEELDNGRILRARSLECCFTDIDLNIIQKQYKYKLTVLDLWRSHYAPLPIGWRSTNLHFFREKTRLKGVPGQELYYSRSKEFVNAIYGDSVQDVAKGEIKYVDGDYILDEEPLSDVLLKKSKHPYKNYQTGVWTTAHARADLQAGIDLCGDRLVYVDTDSCKYLGEVDFSMINDPRRQLAQELGGYADDPAGLRHYLGVFEHEGTARRFRTWGAKKYAFEDSAGELRLTVAGVPKLKGAAELAEKGGLEAFKPGFVWAATGKTEAVYNDVPFGLFEKGGGVLKIGKNIVIRETSYKLDLTDEYSDLLDVSSKNLKKAMKIWLNCELQKKL